MDFRLNQTKSQSIRFNELEKTKPRRPWSHMDILFNTFCWKNFIFGLKISFVIPVWVFMCSTVIVIFLVFIMPDMYSLVFCFNLVCIAMQFLCGESNAPLLRYVIQCLAWCLNAPMYHFSIINVWSWCLCFSISFCTGNWFDSWLL